MQKEKGYPKSQLFLWRMSQELFPDEPVKFNYKASSLFNSNVSMEFDIYYPTLSLVFEYHGEQHYRDVPFQPDQNVQDRDQLKKEVSV